MNTLSKLDPNALAITAVAGRFPGAPTVEAFWANLRAGVESVHFFTDEELRAAGVSVAELANPNYVKARPRLEGVDRFDAGFFGIPPREAELMDPQQRLLLEVAHEALERAALSPDDFDGLVGVFASAAMSGYLLHHLNGHPRAGEAGGAVLGLGNFQDFAATRISYKLNLRGPSFSVQTACSSSLVAVHAAAQSLLNLECDAALAGGAYIGLPQDSGYVYADEGVASPDGRCRPFDAAARGTVFGSGVGLVVMRRLADAVRDRDPIIAVIKGSAVNNDGAIKAGFTAPAVSGQAEVIGEALANAGVNADDISYVEAHGTATPLGDPIEVAALTRAFRETTQRRGYCGLGSVKGNIGHLDVAAGVTGLIKTALALQQGELPATLHFTTPNPKIDFAGSPFQVNATLQPWPRVAGKPRRAGVSAFGVGGTNAHVVLEEAPAAAPHLKSEILDFKSSRPQILTLSAKSPAALDAATRQLAEYLARSDGAPLGDVALTLQTGRRHFEHRRAVVAATTEEARTALVSLDAGRVTTGAVRPGTREVAFLFPGQGAQSVGMGRELYAVEPVFRTEFDRCAELFRHALGADLRRVVHPADGTPALEAEAQLNRTVWAQPTLFAVEYALAKLWLSWGLKPAALLGHSLGEVTAACIAGVFSPEDAVRLVAARGRLMEALPEGALLAVTMPPAELKRRLTPELSLAIVNGPTACVVAGAPGPVAVLEDALRSAGVPARRLPATHAFQSHLMEPVVAPLQAELRTMTLRAPAIPFLSNGSGRWITTAEATSPEYWAQQCRRTVYFGDGLRELAKEPNRLLIEVGPGRILAGLLRPNLDPGDARVVWASLPDARERKPESGTLLGTAGRLWTGGVSLDWRVLGGGGRRKALLPTYPFESQRFWVDPAPRTRAAEATVQREPVDRWFYATGWRQSAVAGGAWPTDTAWIVTSDPAGVRLAERLRASGAVVVERAPGGGWDEVLTAARAGGRALKGVYAGDFLAADSAAQGEAAFMDLLALAPALVATGEQEPLRVLVATMSTQRVRGDEALTAAGAMAAGLAQVLPRELPFVDVRQVDFDSVEPSVEALLQEAVTGDGERLTAWRGGLRWVPQLERMTLPVEGADRLREQGVYVITGGFGGIGLVAAEMLARRVKARLVLAGRRGAAGREPAVAQLEALGASVLAVAADVGTREGIETVFAEAEARWGVVHGVIHAAGVPGRTIAVRKTRTEARAVFGPKLYGAEVIVSALETRAVDFVIFCSSLAVWAGSAGQSDYVAANAYLDAQARVLAARGVRAVSANWDLWSGVGMGASEAKTTDFAITPAEGAEAFVRLLGSRWPGVAVSTAELPRRFGVALTPEAVTSAVVRYPRPALATEYAVPGAGIERVLTEQWQAVLGIDRVGANDNFFELGGDSLTALQAIARIKTQWGVALAVTALYDGSTARALAPVLATAVEARGGQTSAAPDAKLR